MSRPVFEPSDTIQFTITTSIAPDSAPRIRILDANETMVTSITATQSDGTHYYALITLPSDEAPYVAEWLAQRTFSGSAYNFYKRFSFNTSKTRAQ